MMQAAPELMSTAKLRTSLRDHLCNSYLDGKLPLFVIGSGISYGKVPCLTEMVEWLSQKLKGSSDVDSDLRSTLLKQASALTSNRASRFDAAGFFSAFQFVGAEKTLMQIWQNFTRGLVVDGLTFSDKRSYVGLLKLGAHDPSSAHIQMAELLMSGLCHLVNLNYDPLLYLAVHDPEQPTGFRARFISLYTPEDIRRYYSLSAHTAADIRDHTVAHQPSVIHVRGDIFFSTCTNKECPQYGRSRTIEYARYRHAEDVFICPTCHQQSGKLQLSFPGYETKEKLIGKVLATLIKFIGLRISAVISIGVSGQWDQYLLDELFSRATEFEVPIVDVRPSKSGEVNNFELFRLRFYPSVETQYSKDRTSYLRWNDSADDFMRWFCEATHDVLITSDDGPVRFELKP